MSDPTGPQSRAQARKDKSRSRIDNMGAKPALSEEDQLMNEAYGPRGAAMRKTARVMNNSLNVAQTEQDSTVLQKGVARVKRIFKGDGK